MLINYGSCVVSLSHNSIPLYTLTFITNPTADSIELTAPGYHQVLNTITVPANTIVTCEAEKVGYVLYRNTITVTETQTETVALEPGVQFTINPTPSDALVTVTIDGYTYPPENNTTYVPIGRPFSYKVSKAGYAPKFDTITVTQATTLNVQLEALTPYDLSDYDYELDEHENALLESYTGSDPDVTVP